VQFARPEAVGEHPATDAAVVQHELPTEGAMLLLLLVVEGPMVLAQADLQQFRLQRPMVLAQKDLQQFRLEMAMVLL